MPEFPDWTDVGDIDGEKLNEAETISDDDVAIATMVRRERLIGDVVIGDEDDDVHIVGWVCKCPECTMAVPDPSSGGQRRQNKTQPRFRVRGKQSAPPAYLEPTKGGETQT